MDRVSFTFHPDMGLLWNCSNMLHFPSSFQRWMKYFFWALNIGYDLRAPCASRISLELSQKFFVIKGAIWAHNIFLKAWELIAISWDSSVENHDFPFFQNGLPFTWHLQFFTSPLHLSYNLKSQDRVNHISPRHWEVMTWDEWVVFIEMAFLQMLLNSWALFEGFLRPISTWCSSSLPHSPHFGSSFSFRGHKKKQVSLCSLTCSPLFGVFPSSNPGATWTVCMPLLQTSSPSRQQLSARLSPGERESKWDPNDRNNK